MQRKWMRWTIARAKVRTRQPHLPAVFDRRRRRWRLGWRSTDPPTRTPPPRHRQHPVRRESLHKPHYGIWRQAPPLVLLHDSNIVVWSTNRLQSHSHRSPDATTHEMIESAHSMTVSSVAQSLRGRAYRSQGTSTAPTQGLSHVGQAQTRGRLLEPVSPCSHWSFAKRRRKKWDASTTLSQLDGATR